MPKLLSLAIKTSRPKFWLYLAGTYLVGYAFGIRNPLQLVNPEFIIHFLYFLIPANVFLYGINDYFDGATDRLNPKKDDEKEHLLKEREKYSLLAILFIAASCTFFLLAIQNNDAKILLLSSFLFLSYFYSAPPLRFKQTPILDFMSNSLYIIPGIFGYYQSTFVTPNPIIVIGAFCWTFAMHLFSAIPDIQPDSEARIYTSAVFFGKKASLLLCFLFWGVSAYTAIRFLPFGIGFVAIIYPLIPLLVFFRKTITTEKIYWFFPYLNSFFGFLLFLVAIIGN